MRGRPRVSPCQELRAGQGRPFQVCARVGKRAPVSVPPGCFCGSSGAATDLSLCRLSLGRSGCQAAGEFSSLGPGFRWPNALLLNFLAVIARKALDTVDQHQRPPSCLSSDFGWRGRRGRFETRTVALTSPGCPLSLLPSQQFCLAQSDAVPEVDVDLRGVWASSPVWGLDWARSRFAGQALVAAKMSCPGHRRRAGSARCRRRADPSPSRSACARPSARRGQRQ